MTKDDLDIARSYRRSLLMEFGEEVLSPRRDRRGLTLEQMAARIGIHPSAIYRTEDGRTTPKDGATAEQYKKHYRLSEQEYNYWIHIIWGTSLEVTTGTYEDLNRSYQEQDAAEILSRLMDEMRRVYAPAYIIDPYCDVIACNAPSVELLDLESAGLSLDKVHSRPSGANMLHYVFSKEAKDFYGPLMGRYWHNYRCQNMMIFKNLSSRYRSTQYFKVLLHELMEYPHFEHYWRKARLESEGRLVVNEERDIHLESPRWGRLVYSSTSTPVTTPVGELYLCYYVPTNRETAEAFVQLVENAGDEIYSVGSWPDK